MFAIFWPPVVSNKSLFDRRLERSGFVAGKLSTFLCHAARLAGASIFSSVVFYEPCRVANNEFIKRFPNCRAFRSCFPVFPGCRIYKTVNDCCLRVCSPPPIPVRTDKDSFLCARAGVLLLLYAFVIKVAEFSARAVVGALFAFAWADVYPGASDLLHA